MFIVNQTAGCLICDNSLKLHHIRHSKPLQDLRYNRVRTKKSNKLAVYFILFYFLNSISFIRLTIIRDKK